VLGARLKIESSVPPPRQTVSTPGFPENLEPKRQGMGVFAWSRSVSGTVATIIEENICALHISIRDSELGEHRSPGSQAEIVPEHQDRRYALSWHRRP
jgi:hypothetical protein